MLDSFRNDKKTTELLQPSIKFKENIIKYPTEDASHYTSEEDADW